MGLFEHIVDIKFVEIPQEFGNKLLDTLRYLQVIIPERLPHLTIKSYRGFG